MSDTVGILAASIGITDKGPGISNEAIARNLVRVHRCVICKGEKAFVAVQWEVDDALQNLGYSLLVNLSIPVQERGKYLSSDDLVEIAIPLFRERGVKEVVVVTDWILWVRIARILRKRGFKVRLRGISWVPMDRGSIQPWTRGHLTLFYYAIRRILFGYKGRYIEPRNYEVRIKKH